MEKLWPGRPILDPEKAQSSVKCLDLRIEDLIGTWKIMKMGARRIYWIGINFVKADRGLEYIHPPAAIPVFGFTYTLQD